MSTDENALLDKISSLNSWEEWYDFEKKFFNESMLIRKSHEELERSLNRKDRTIDGIDWHAAGCNYTNLHLYFLYEKMLLLVFAKLEPEAAANNAEHPEWYGKVCYHCEIWTESHDLEICPICSGELLPLPLDADE